MRWGGLVLSRFCVFNILAPIPVKEIEAKGLGPRPEPWPLLESGSRSAAHGLTRLSDLRVSRVRFIQMLLERRNYLLWKEPFPLWASEAPIEAQ